MNKNHSIFLKSFIWLGIVLIFSGVQTQRSFVTNPNNNNKDNDLSNDYNYGLPTKPELIEGLKLATQIYLNFLDYFSSLVYDKSIPQLTISEFTYPSTTFVQFGEAAIEHFFATDVLKKIIIRKTKGNIGKEQIGQYLLTLNFTSPNGPQCLLAKELKIHACDKNVREIDGFCNNLKHRHWGMATIPHKRLLYPDYGDGLNSPRLAQSGNPLPNPRIITTKIFGNEDKPHSSLSILTMTFGQFLDHDITQTPFPTGRQSPKLECCQFKYKHPLCYGLLFPLDDPFYSRYNQTCMNAVRSFPALRPDCRIGPREQMNQITSYIDASNIYGSTLEENYALRLVTSPRLKVAPNPTNSRLRELLPAMANLQIEECIYARRAKYHCFRAGDERSNENTALTAMHTIWVREHNRVAEWLENLNEHWPKEKCMLAGTYILRYSATGSGFLRSFQETRKIIGAMLQHITYKEFLPALLGPIEIQRHKLELADTGYFSGYSEDIDATTANSFGAAVFRLGHSLIKIGHFGIYHSAVPLKNTLRQPRGIYLSQFPEGVDPLLRGLARTPANIIDHNFAADINNHLFQHENQGYGMDLLALNIHRGRDHGIPGYNAFRELCGLKKFETWDDMKDAIPFDVVDKMSKIYESVDDVDLFPGGISEYHAEGAEIGPTFACIMGDQFFRLRFGDRFWYENENRTNVIEHAFTPAQLQEIRKTSMAKVLCQNSDGISIIQRDLFHLPNFNNPLLPCKELPDINLSAWIDRNRPKINTDNFVVYPTLNITNRITDIQNNINI